MTETLVYLCQGVIDIGRCIEIMPWTTKIQCNML